MITVYKYPLEIKDEQTLDIPVDAEILSIQEQLGCICAWVRLDTDSPKEPRKIFVRGTSHPVSNDWYWIATLQQGPMVWHFFEPSEIDYEDV